MKVLIMLIMLSLLSLSAYAYDCTAYSLEYVKDDAQYIKQGLPGVSRIEMVFNLYMTQDCFYIKELHASPTQKYLQPIDMVSLTLSTAGIRNKVRFDYHDKRINPYIIFYDSRWMYTLNHHTDIR